MRLCVCMNVYIYTRSWCVCERQCMFSCARYFLSFSLSLCVIQILKNDWKVLSNMNALLRHWPLLVTQPIIWIFTCTFRSEALLFDESDVLQYKIRKELYSCHVMNYACSFISFINIYACFKQSFEGRWHIYVFNIHCHISPYITINLEHFDELRYRTKLRCRKSIVEIL